ncbi:MAG: hypothetical protein ACK56I_00695, partial [bacterium]
PRKPAAPVTATRPRLGMGDMETPPTDEILLASFFQLRTHHAAVETGSLSLRPQRNSGTT